MSAGKPQGRAHRDVLRKMILPGVRAGAVLPTGEFLGVALGVCGSEAMRHLKRMLAEEGISTYVAWGGTSKRIRILESVEHD